MSELKKKKKKEKKSKVFLIKDLLLQWKTFVLLTHYNAGTALHITFVQKTNKT